MRNNTGFTLIELLVVIVILGISLTFALLSFGDFGKSKNVIMAAEGLSNQLKLAQQRAIIETATLGLQFNDKGYQLYRYTTKGEWVILANKGVFRWHPLPENCHLKLVKPIKVTRNQPPIIISPTGEVSPFKLEFYLKNNDMLITTILAQSDGQLKLSRSQ